MNDYPRCTHEVVGMLHRFTVEDPRLTEYRMSFSVEGADAARAIERLLDAMRKPMPVWVEHESRWS